MLFPPLLAFAGMLLGTSGLCLATPGEGTVTAGAGSINTNGSTTTINQTSDKLALNWQSFNIGPGETVRFVQPGSASIALNRVIGSDPSAIYGTLSANGKVFLINPNGVLFGSTAQVNVGGLVASTLNLSNGDFLSGDYTFSGNSGSVINQGSIRASDGGYVALLGSQVTNEGVIIANRGTVALGAGNQITLDFNGDALISLAVDQAALSALAENKQLATLQADGGQVIMTAKAADALAGTVVNNSGQIRARSISNVNGEIILDGGINGMVANSGALDASGKSAGETGGTVKVLGNTVSLNDGSQVDVSGNSGGGTALIGGNFQGRGPEYNATRTTVAAGTTVNADAITDGNGGQVAVWADDTTEFHGSITARGGATGGDGGRVETSGFKFLNVTGGVNAGAPRGERGSWLLDPTYANIDAATAASIMTSLNNDTNVSVTNWHGDITVASALSWTTGATLFFGGSNNAPEVYNLYINAPITATSGGLTLMNIANATATASIDVGMFSLKDYLNYHPVWRQINASLPGFTARDFSIGGGATFIRALGGDGTAGNPYRLADIYGVQSIGSYDMNAKAYVLANNIPAAITSTWNPNGSDGYSGFAPIGTDTYKFSGVFDGGNYTIDGLYVNTGISNAGLFAVVNGATIRNIGLTNVNITGSANVGGLAGYLTDGSVTNAYVTGSVSGSGSGFGVGGLIGESWNASITNSYNGATVSSSSNDMVGGLVGNNSTASNIMNSYSTGNVTGTSQAAKVGGLVGYNNSAAITGSYSTGSVNGAFYTGGLVGWDNLGTITNSYHVTGTVTSSRYAGGLVGYAYGTAITNGYNTGGVSAGGSYEGYAGGIVGYGIGMSGNGAISSSYNTGSVAITNNGYSVRSAGGLLGASYDFSIRDSYSTGSVTMTGGASGSGGGLVGQNLGSGQINQSYSTGAVSGFSNAGGLVGGITNMGGYNSYWDIQTSGQATTRGNGTGLTSDQMKYQGNFVGFNFTTKWRIYDGQTSPLLKAFLTPLTVTANNVIKTYDGNAYSGDNGASFSTGGQPGGVQGTLAYGGSAQGAMNAGTYAITPGGLYSTGQQGYDITFVSGTLTVNKKTLTVNGLTASSKIYDGTTAASVNGTLGGVVGSDAVSLTGGAFDDKKVGAGKTVTVDAASLTGAAAGNYTIGTATTTANISARPITVTVTGQSKIYDGNTTASVAYGSNRVAGDTLTISGTASFGDKNVGTGKTVNISDIGISGADAGNYTLSNTTAATTANITVRPITVTAAGVNKVYDGTTNADVTLSDNRVSGDTLAISGTASFGDKNVGTGKAVSVSGFSISGNDAGNYTLSNTTATTTANITARPITVTVTGQNKTYDGSTTASVTYGDNRLTGDTLTISGTASFGDKNVSTGKAVNVSGISISGGDAGNYTLSNTTASTTADITARSLTVTAAGVNKVYDGMTNANVILSDNRVSGDALTIGNTGASFGGKNAGTGKTVSVSGIGISGADAGNYTLQNTTAATTADITARPLTVTAAGQNKTYDGSTTASVTYGDNRLTGDTLTISGTASFGDKNVGTGKAVSVSGFSISGDDAGNYTLSNTTASATADITARSLTVTAAGVNKVYDGTTNADVILSDNRVSGDALTIGNTGASFGGKNAGTGKAVSVGGISISGGDAGNYALQNTTAITTADITTRPLTVTAAGVNKVYDGSTTASVNYGDNRVTGDTLTIGGTARFGDKNVNTGKTVSFSGISISGADAGNYTLNNTTASATADITARSLTVTAAGVNKVYDGSTTASVSYGDNRVTGDALAIGGTASFGDKNVNTGKTVSVSGISISGADAGNYALQNTTASTAADITARSLTVTATGINKVYDGTTGADVTFSDNRVSGDVLTVSSTGASFGDKDAGTGKTVSVSGISISGDDAGNYTLNNTTASATADITARSLTIRANNASKWSGAPNPAFSGTYTGLAGSDTAAALNGTLLFNTAATTASPVGQYAIIPSGVNSTNYSITFVPGILTVQPSDPINSAITGANHAAQGGHNPGQSGGWAGDSSQGDGGVTDTLFFIAGNGIDPGTPGSNGETDDSGQIN